MVTPPDVVRHIDRLAERNGLSRSSQARMLLLGALRASAAPDDEVPRDAA
jgi:hypothetical protein